MNIIIFGATGGTGQQLIAQALNRGHSVSAFVRDTKKITLKNDMLKIIEGDVLDIQSVGNAVQNHDAVMCSLGLPAIMDKSNIRAKGTKNIIEAMQKNNIERLVCQSALGVSESYQLLPFMYKYILAPFIMKHLYRDHELQEKHIKECNLNWTIVRPAALTNGGFSGKYQHGTDTTNKTLVSKISRADTADFMLNQLGNNTYSSKSPYLSY